MTPSLLTRQRAHQSATPTALAAQAGPASGAAPQGAHARRLAPGSGAFNLAAAAALAAAREE